MGLHGTQGVELVESVLQGGEKEEGMGREEGEEGRRREEEGMGRGEGEEGRRREEEGMGRGEGEERGIG